MVSAEAGYPMLVPGSWDDLLAAWRDTDLPPGWRAEIIKGNIVSSPAPGNEHNGIADLVDEALRPVRPAECGIYQHLAVAIPRLKKLFLPDLVVVPRAAVRDRPDHEPVPAGEALLAVEITARTNANVDRTTKRWGYGISGVPLYLLIDRFHDDGPSVTLLSQVADGHYQNCLRVPFGEKIALPAPFGFDLDTGEF